MPLPNPVLVATDAAVQAANNAAIAADAAVVAANATALSYVAY